jgi:hypothetical protein
VAKSKTSSSPAAEALPAQTKSVHTLLVLERLMGLASLNGQVPQQLRAVLRYASELARDARNGGGSYSTSVASLPLVRFPNDLSRTPRWICTVAYRTHGGLLQVEHALEELSLLHGIIEDGPGFYTIDRIEVRTAASSTMTIEQSLAV